MKATCGLLMVHEIVLVFSKEKPTIEKIEEIFEFCFYNKEKGYYTVDAFSGIIEFPFIPNNLKEKNFIQLTELWKLKEWDNDDNISGGKSHNITSYISIDNELKNGTSSEILSYAQSLPQTMWITRMWIAP